MGEELEKPKLYMKVNGEYRELGVLADIKDIEPEIEDEDYYQCDIPEEGFSMDFELSKKDAKRLKSLLVTKNKKEFRKFIKRK